MTVNARVAQRSQPQWLVLAVLLLVCLATGAVGAAWTSLSLGDWYATLRKPPWTPPNGLFGPVWTTMYVMMAVAAWLVWRSGSRHGRDRRLPVLVFAIQLALNAAWSGLFFGLRSPGSALVDIALLWCAIAATVLVFARRSRMAAALLVPYLAWVSFATALNWAIWRMNA
jgi:benzodiazapine receptor